MLSQAKNRGQTCGQMLFDAEQKDHEKNGKRNCESTAREVYDDKEETTEQRKEKIKQFKVD